MIVYVDVDDTLGRTIGTKRIPMPASVARVKHLFADGADLFLWSSGGAAYARESAVELGIEHCFAGFLPKPNLILDDQTVAEWRYCSYEHPLAL